MCLTIAKYYNCRQWKFPTQDILWKLSRPENNRNGWARAPTITLPVPVGGYLFGRDSCASVCGSVRLWVHQAKWSDLWTSLFTITNGSRTKRRKKYRQQTNKQWCDLVLFKWRPKCSLTVPISPSDRPFWSLKVKDQREGRAKCRNRFFFGRNSAAHGLIYYYY